MLRIRLSRTGKKRYASYRIVVADVESKRDGRYVEQIGHYTPMTNPITFSVQEERALHWLSVGAQPSDAVRRLLEKQGTYARLERMRAGEPFEALVAEYEGRQWPPVAAVAAEEPAPVVEESRSIAERIGDAVEGAVDAVKDAAAAAIDTVGDVAERVSDAFDGDADDQVAADAADAEEQAV